MTIDITRLRPRPGADHQRSTREPVELGAIDRALEPFDALKLNQIHPDEDVRGAIRLVASRARELELCDADRPLLRACLEGRIEEIRGKDWSSERRKLELDRAFTDEQPVPVDPRKTNGTRSSSPDPRPKLPIRLSPGRIALRLRARAVGRRLTTGFPTLDRAVREGIPLGRLVMLLGAPGAAKTTLATYLLEQWERQGAVCVYLAADEADDGILIRLGQLNGFVREQLEAEGPEGDAARSKFDEAVAGRQFAIVDPDGDGDPDTLEAVIDGLKAFAGERPCVLFVDSLQTVRCVAAERASTPRERIDAKIQLLKHAAKSGVLVIVISEMARGAYRTGDREQDTNALAAGKESGAIEYSAALLLALRSVKGEHGLIDVEVPKNRLGSAKPELRLRLDFARASLAEVDRPIDEAKSGAISAAKREKAREKLLGLVATNPGSSAQQLRSLARLQNQLVSTSLNELEHEGAIRAESGTRGERLYYFVQGNSHGH